MTTKEGASAKIIFNATIDECLDVITDYKSYPDFLDSIKEVKIVKTSEDGNVVDVWYRTNISIKTIEYTLRHYREKNALRWESLGDGPWDKNTGGWFFTELAKDKQEAEYVANIEFSVWVPAFLKNFIIGSSLPATLEAFKQEIERRRALKK